MIEQNGQILTLTFPTVDSATTFAAFLATLLQPTSLPANGTFDPPSGQLPVAESDQLSQMPTQASPEPGRSRHTVLTDERLDQLFNQRQNGMTAHQQLLRAQTTLRDGTLPFKQLSTAPPASGQPSPRMKAQQEGGFADGGAVAGRPIAPQLAVPADGAVPPEAERRKRSQLKRSSPPPSRPPSKS